MPGPTISVVVPIHNEADYLEAALGRLLVEIAGCGADCEVILAENGSTDDTAALAQRLAAREPSVSTLSLDEPDYGAAMRAGFARAAGEWAVNFDIDYFSGQFLRDGLDLADRADIVLASKRAPGADDRRDLLRRAGTLVFNLLLKALFGTGVSDTHGMKLVRTRVISEIAPTVVSNLDLFDTELVIRAERAGFRIAEVPVTVEEQRGARSSFLSRVPRTLRGLARIRWRMWRER